MIYYVSGFPYSDELYHYGTLGQKWGIRRYQNPDGSYTALGRIHYGIGKAGEAVGNATKSVINYGVKQIKKKYPRLMNDAELQAHINRLRLENAYLSELDRKHPVTARGKKVALDILESGTKSLANKLIEKSIDNLLKEIKPSDILFKQYKDSLATMDDADVKKLAERFENIRKIEGSSNNKKKK